MGLTNLDDTNKELIEKKLVNLIEDQHLSHSNTKREEDIQFRTDQLKYFYKLETARTNNDTENIKILVNLTNPEIDRHQYQKFLRDIPEEYKDFFFDDQL